MCGPASRRSAGQGPAGQRPASRRPDDTRNKRMTLTHCSSPRRAGCRGRSVNLNFASPRTRGNEKPSGPLEGLGFEWVGWSERRLGSVPGHLMPLKHTRHTTANRIKCGPGQNHQVQQVAQCDSQESLTHRFLSAFCFNRNLNPDTRVGRVYPRGTGPSMRGRGWALNSARNAATSRRNSFSEVRLVGDRPKENGSRAIKNQGFQQKPMDPEKDQGGSASTAP